MGDLTRKDNGRGGAGKGNGAGKLFVTIELDLATNLSTIETNVNDPTVLLRVLGAGIQVWADDRMKKIAAALQQPRRPLVLPPRADS